SSHSLSGGDQELVGQELEEIINEDHGSESGAKLIKEIVALASESVSVGSQSMEMLKVRASLEEKLKRREFLAQNKQVGYKPEVAFKWLETLDDFGDEVMDKDSGNANLSNGRSSSMHSTKLLKVVAPKLTKLKGPYYCGVGADKAFGCDIVDSHYKACLLCRYQH
ncbi:hypothetical protein IFM89_005126, partial [Coptis chinensis]